MFLKLFFFRFLSLSWVKWFNLITIFQLIWNQQVDVGYYVWTCCFFCLRKSIFDFLTTVDCLFVGRVWWDSANATWHFSGVELWDSDAAAGGFQHFCCLKLFFGNIWSILICPCTSSFKDIRVEFWNLWHKKIQFVRMDPTIRNDPKSSKSWFCKWKDSCNLEVKPPEISPELIPNMAMIFWKPKIFHRPSIRPIDFWGRHSAENPLTLTISTWESQGFPPKDAILLRFKALRPSSQMTKNSYHPRKNQAGFHTWWSFPLCWATLEVAPLCPWPCYVYLMESRWGSSRQETGGNVLKRWICFLKGLGWVICFMLIMLLWSKRWSRWSRK